MSGQRARRGAGGPVGSASSAALAVAAAIVVCALLGFYLGRYVLGEQYLKRGAARIRTLPQPRVAVNPAPAPPVVEEMAPPQEEAPGETLEAARSAPAPRASSERVQSPPPRAESGVTLQLGCFLDPEKARFLVQDLRNRGYSPTVRVEKQGESTLHRVQMGPLSAAEARALQSDLRRQGYEVMQVGGG